MCLAGTINIQPQGVTHRRLPPQKKPPPPPRPPCTKEELAHKGFYFLGQFKTRNAINSRNKNRSYFYKRLHDHDGEPDHIGTLLLCTRKGFRKWYQYAYGGSSPKNAKYTVVKRIKIYKNTDDGNTKVMLMKRGLEAGNVFKNAKWVRITSIHTRLDTVYRKAIEIRDGSGWSNSSDKVQLLINYFSDVLERPRPSVWGKGVENQPTDKEEHCEKCVPVEVEPPNHAACTWKCYRKRYNALHGSAI